MTPKMRGYPLVAGLAAISPVLVVPPVVAAESTTDDSVRVEILSKDSGTEPWPFAAFAMAVTCEKIEGSFRIALGWESPFDGTGDWTTIALDPGPPFRGDVIEAGRSTFDDIVLPGTDQSEILHFLRDARTRGEALCETLG